MELWYTQLAEPLEPAHLLPLLRQLPPAWQARVLSRRRLASRLGSLHGALLLQHALRRCGHRLDEVQRTAEGRPWLPGTSLDFNLTHAGRYAVCALSATGRVGLDAEPHAPRDWAAFAPHFTAAEWAAVQADTDPQRAFYRLWTQKEAVAKADGRGLDLPLRAIRLRGATAELDGRRWHLREVPLAADYTLHLASSDPTAAGPPRRVAFGAEPISAQ